MGTNPVIAKRLLEEEKAAGLQAVATVGQQDGQGVYFTPPHVLGAIDPAVGNPPFLAQAIDALPTVPTDWTQVKGVSTEIAAALNHLGLTYPEKLRAFTIAGGDLTAIPGIGKARARAIVDWAEDQL